MELRQSLAWCKNILLFSAGRPVSNHAPLAFARHFVLPAVNQPGWLDELSNLVAAERITHIFPAHDEALLALAENAAQLKAKVVTSPLETCRITRSKTATLRHLSGVIPVPQIFPTAAAVKTWPVFLKPDYHWRFAIICALHRAWLGGLFTRGHGGIPAAFWRILVRQFKVGSSWPAAPYA